MMEDASRILQDAYRNEVKVPSTSTQGRPWTAITSHLAIDDLSDRDDRVVRIVNKEV